MLKIPTKLAAMQGINGYSEEAHTDKMAFLREGSTFLRSLAKEIGMPEGSYGVRTNKGGPPSRVKSTSTVKPCTSGWKNRASARVASASPTARVAVTVTTAAARTIASCWLTSATPTAGRVSSPTASDWAGSRNQPHEGTRLRPGFLLPGLPCLPPPSHFTPFRNALQVPSRR